MKGYSKHLLQVILLTAFAFGLSSTNAFAGGSVVPPQQKAFDLNYEEWTARWVQFVWGLPAADNPLEDTTGALCGKGQWGPVVFLYGVRSAGPSTPVTRTCTISSKKGLLIPLYNLFAAVPEDGSTPEEVGALLTSVGDLIDANTLAASIDGVAIQNLDKFRFRTPVFSFTGASPNLYSFDCGAPPCYEGFHEQGLGEGYYILVNPLSPGKHTLHVHGELPDWQSVQDVTYQLTVVP